MFLMTIIYVPLIIFAVVQCPLEDAILSNATDEVDDNQAEDKVGNDEANDEAGDKADGNPIMSEESEEVVEGGGHSPS